MPPIDEPASFEQKSQAAEGRRSRTSAATPEQPGGPDLFAFTVDAASRRIVNIERVEAAGARRGLSDDDRSRLAETDAGTTLQSLVERAFEAGIDSVLGEEADETPPAESKEDAQLSRLLLQSLITRSAARHLLQGELLNRAIVGTLIEYAAGGHTAPPEGAAH